MFIFLLLSIDHEAKGLFTIHVIIAIKKSSSYWKLNVSIAQETQFLKPHRKYHS